MKIIAYPYNGSAYTDAFYSALSPKVEVIAGEWSGQWMWANIGSEDVVHFHWPSFYYSSEGPSLGIYWRFFRFVLLLLVLHFRAKAIFWTAHNLLPHKRCSVPKVDVWARILLIRLASRIFVHGKEAEKVFVGKFPTAKSKCLCIPHGNWNGYYPKAPSRIEARERLGFTENAFIVELFGFCRPYKNVHGLIRAFNRIATSGDYLLIAGQFSSAAYRQEVESLAAENPNVRIDSRFIPDADVPMYISACDVLCVPYQEVLTSGTAMLALTYGRPVISINRGFLRDVVPKDVGVLVEPGDEFALTEALLKAKQENWSEEAIRAHSRRFEFQAAADLLLDEASGVTEGRVGLADL
ncbi:glycosyltransferase [Marinimicrobium sp. ABcell2]|uniref:glycosyltransferase n=1 Tax=Marinimicrobium sp. ABcell2 TaxID=3069751 RepID=UPI0027B1A252|nr:glycosyltransferase [Marinimicrobium sp. ABcell2]MDQ2076177.1 glycosyltransferase [Marinimicrobium sp. ABcell2]